MLSHIQMDKKGDIMFLVMELQVSANGTVGNIVTSHNTLPEAQNKFYTICAFAAVSDVPIHSAIILDRTGVLIDRQCFEHPIEVEPESEG